MPDGGTQVLGYGNKKHSNIKYYCAFLVTDKVRISNSSIEDCKKIVALRS